MCRQLLNLSAFVALADWTKPAEQIVAQKVLERCEGVLGLDI